MTIVAVQKHILSSDEEDLWDPSIFVNANPSVFFLEDQEKDEEGN